MGRTFDREQYHHCHLITVVNHSTLGRDDHRFPLRARYFDRESPFRFEFLSQVSRIFTENPIPPINDVDTLKRTVLEKCSETQKENRMTLRSLVNIGNKVSFTVLCCIILTEEYSHLICTKLSYIIDLIVSRNV